MMKCHEAVTLTRAAGSARLAVSSSIGGPSTSEEDCRGRGIVDFRSDRLLMTDRLVTRRMASRASRKKVMIAVTRPALALGNYIIGREAFYEGGARWIRRGRQWKGPDGSVGLAKTTWHPLFLLELFEPVMCPLTSARPEMLGKTEVYRCEVAPRQEEMLPIAFNSWMLSQPADVTERRETIRPPRAVLWVANDGLLRAFAYEVVVGSGNDSTLWSTTRLCSFGTSTAEIGHVADELAA